MAAGRVFLDSNVLLYLLSDDTAKADRAEEILKADGTISVQVLNEVTNVARRKLAMPWSEINELLSLIKSLCKIAPLTLEVHERGTLVAQRYGMSVYDAMIVAAALIAECDTLYSEDMQDGLLVDRRLRIRNPF